MGKTWFICLSIGLAILPRSVSAQLSHSEARFLQTDAIRELWAIDSTKVLCIGISSNQRSGSYSDPAISDADSTFLAGLGASQQFRPRSACRVEQGSAFHTVFTQVDDLRGSLVIVSAPAIVPDSGHVRLTVQRMNGGRNGGVWACKALRNERGWARQVCSQFAQY